MEIGIKPGDVIHSYRFEQPIGYGAYGMVWRVHHEYLDKPFAIKVVDTHDLDEQNLERVKQECHIGGKLSDWARVVEVRDAFLEDDRLFIVMELMAGGSLDHYLRGHPCPDFGLTLTWALDLCAALEEVHALGVVHRDIKPQNILLADDGQVKLSDFGVAHLPESNLTTAFQPGSPAYRAPEQEANKPVDSRADVWSLCAVFFEVWTGLKYFRLRHADQDDVRDEMALLLAENYPSLSPGLRSRLMDVMQAGLLPCSERISLADLQNALGEIQADLQYGEGESEDEIIDVVLAQVAQQPRYFASQHWRVAPPAQPGHIARFPRLHPIVVQVLYNRGLTDPVDVAAFLEGGEDWANPFDLKGMPAAVTRLRRALRADEPIAVYGDFDADGVTATALLVQVLRALGGYARPYIPDRAEGYGLHKEALIQLAHAGVRLVVTADCGVRAPEQVAYANQLGLDVIVTDHHSVGSTLPDAVAVINPMQASSRYPFRELAGVGIAYRLAQALLRSHRQTPVARQSVRLEERDLLDLVALGTIVDLVPLLGENRALVQHGLACINRMERPGIKALCRQAGLRPGQVDAAAVSYVLGPRLEAAGRLAHAKLAYQLLETRYPVEAEQLAGELDRLNRRCEQLTLETQERALRLARATKQDPPLLFAAAPDFHAGIIGPVASHLVNRFYRPAVVVEVGEAVSRGSARSIPEFHITRALDECADLLVRHGGHAGAAVFNIRNEHLEELDARLWALVTEQLGDVELTPILYVDTEVELSQVSWELQQALSQLEPCGYANPCPVFLSRNVGVQHRRAVGSEGRHLKLGLSDGWGTWDAIVFWHGEWTGKLPDRVDIVCRLEVSEWNDERRLLLNVQDIRPAELD